MRVTLLFFAVLREITGREQLDLELATGSRASDLWADLRNRHPQLGPYREPPLVAINEEYAAPDAILHDGDRIAFIPPVAGG